jgi:subtilisin family serine protease
MLTAQNGRAMVAASGNAGNVKYHVKTMLTNSDTLFTWFEPANATNFYYYIYADTSDIKNVQTSIGVNRAGSFDLGRIPFHNYNYALSAQQVDTLKYNNKRIGIIKSNASINSSGVYEALFHVIADSLNYLWRIESKGSGKHDAWDFNLKSAGLPTSTVYPKIVYYAMPDTLSTIVSGFQCSNEVITVGNYINLNKWTDVNNNAQTSTEVPGQIKETSSQGPTRRNVLKPDVVATGANVFSSMPLSLQTFMITNAPTAVAQGSMHIQGGGTSASSPVVAGLAALFLQAYPNASNQQVKQAISNCTYSDGFTGTLPNCVYGYGKLDGLAAMLCSSIFTGIEKVNLGDGIFAKPNPFHEKVEITLKKDAKGLLEIYDVSGKCILKQNISDSFILDTDQINAYKGLLLIRVTTSSANYSAKLISY